MSLPKPSLKIRLMAFYYRLYFWLQRDRRIEPLYVYMVVLAITVVMLGWMATRPA